VTDGILERLLEPGALRAVFQPIVDVSRPAPAIHCFEALTRGPAGGNLERAEVLFDYVRLRHQEAAVDRVCVALACEAARELPPEPALSLNVHAITLSRDPQFLAFLGDRLRGDGLPAERLIVEIVEYAPHLADASLRQARERLRRWGARVALDDVGFGHSNYRMMVDLAPDYFKLDRHIVQRCHDDFRRRAVLESVCLLADRFDARVVAEGVEDAAELATLREVGVSLVQGHLFSRAAPVREVADLVFGGPPRPHLPDPAAANAVSA
jgi:EAL domain-containing protein (putative c-di-GMP-specific phosphodiesterase class I)